MPIPVQPPEPPCPRRPSPGGSSAVCPSRRAAHRRGQGHGRHCRRGSLCLHNGSPGFRFRYRIGRRVRHSRHRPGPGSDQGRVETVRIGRSSCHLIIEVGIEAVGLASEEGHCSRAPSVERRMAGRFELQHGAKSGKRAELDALGGGRPRRVAFAISGPVNPANRSSSTSRCSSESCCKARQSRSCSSARRACSSGVGAPSCTSSA